MVKENNKRILPEKDVQKEFLGAYVHNRNHSSEDATIHEKNIDETTKRGTPDSLDSVALADDPPDGGLRAWAVIIGVNVNLAKILSSSLTVL